MQRAMGLHLSFGKGMLGFGILLTLAAVGAAVVSLVVENDWLQVVPLAAIVGSSSQWGCSCDLGKNRQRQPAKSTSAGSRVRHHLRRRVDCCVRVYVGNRPRHHHRSARTAGLYASSIGSILLAFTLMLVSSALRSRERYYCLGLAISPFLAGMLLPIIDPHYSFPLAHCFMAAGFFTGAAIQWVQLRDGVANHAAD